MADLVVEGAGGTRCCWPAEYGSHFVYGAIVTLGCGRGTLHMRLRLDCGGGTEVRLGRCLLARIGARHCDYTLYQVSGPQCGMQRSNAATRQFYAAFFKWSILSARAASCPATKRSFTHSQRDAVNVLGRRRHRDDYETRRNARLNARGNALLHHETVRSTAQVPFETLQPWEYAVRFRTDTGLMVEYAVPVEKIHEAEERYGRDMRRLEDETNIRIEIRDSLVPYEGSGPKLRSVLLSGVSQDVVEAHKKLLDFAPSSASGGGETYYIRSLGANPPERAHSRPAAPEDAPTKAEGPDDKLRTAEVQSAHDKPSSKIKPFHFLVRSRSEQRVSIEMCIPEDKWQAISAHTSPDFLRGRYGSDVYLGSTALVEIPNQNGKFEVRRYLTLAGTFEQVAAARGSLYRFWDSTVADIVKNKGASDEPPTSVEEAAAPQLARLIPMKDECRTRVSIPGQVRKHFRPSRKLLDDIRDSSGCLSVKFAPMADNEEYIRIVGSQTASKRALTLIHEQMAAVAQERRVTLGPPQDLIMSDAQFKPALHTHSARIRLPYPEIMNARLIGKQRASVNYISEITDCEIVDNARIDGKGAWLLLGTRGAVRSARRRIQTFVEASVRRQGLRPQPVETLASDLLRREEAVPPESGPHRKLPSSSLQHASIRQTDLEGRRQPAERVGNATRHDRFELPSDNKLFIILALPRGRADMLGEIGSRLNNTRIQNSLTIRQVNTLPGRLGFYIRASNSSALEKVKAELQALCDSASVKWNEPSFGFELVEQGEGLPNTNVGDPKLEKRLGSQVKSMLASAQREELPAQNPETSAVRQLDAQKQATAVVAFPACTLVFAMLGDRRSRLLGKIVKQAGVVDIVDLGVADGMSRLRVVSDTWSSMQAAVQWLKDIVNLASNAEATDRYELKVIDESWKDTEHNVSLAAEDGSENYDVEYFAVLAIPKDRTKAIDKVARAFKRLPRAYQVSCSLVDNIPGRQGYHLRSKDRRGLINARSILEGMCGKVSRGSDTPFTVELVEEGTGQPITKFEDWVPGSAVAERSTANASGNEQVSTAGSGHSTSNTRTVEGSGQSTTDDPDQKAQSPTTELERLVQDSRKQFRQLTYPVVVITCRAPGKAPDTDPLAHNRGVTVSSLSTVTLHPTPIISFNLRLPSRTWDAMDPKFRIAIHFLAASPAGAAIAHAFTLPSERPHEPFLRLQELRGVHITHRERQPPLIRYGKGVLARMEAEILPEKTVDVGDHKVVFAEVRLCNLMRAGGGDEAVGALAYGMQGYRGLGLSVMPLELECGTAEKHEDAVEGGAVADASAASGPESVTYARDVQADQSYADAADAAEQGIEGDVTAPTLAPQPDAPRDSVAHDPEESTGAFDSQDFAEVDEAADSVPDFSSTSEYSSHEYFERMSREPANVDSTVGSGESSSVQVSMPEGESVSAIEPALGLHGSDSERATAADVAPTGHLSVLPEADQASNEATPASSATGADARDEYSDSLVHQPDSPTQSGLPIEASQETSTSPNATQFPPARSTAKQSAPWGIQPTKRSYSTSAKTPSLPQNILKSTVEDYLAPTAPYAPRHRHLMQAQKESRLATRRLEKALATGSLTPAESEAMESTIAINERKVAKKLAMNAAFDLRALLDRGKTGEIDARRVQWMEGCIERGLAVLLEEAKLVKGMLDEGKLKREEFEKGKGIIAKEHELMSTELMRLRGLMDEDEDVEFGGGGEEADASAGRKEGGGFDGFRGNL